MENFKCITFDSNAQDLLPEHIKAKMKADKEKAKKTTSYSRFEPEIKEYAEGVNNIFSPSKVDVRHIIELAVKTGIRLAKRWNSITEGLPTENKRYLVKGRTGIEYLSYFNPATKEWSSNCSITHWRDI